MSAEVKASLAVLGVVLYFAAIGVACYFDSIISAIILLWVPIVGAVLLMVWIQAYEAFRR